MPENYEPLGAVANRVVINLARSAPSENLQKDRLNYLLEIGILTPLEHALEIRRIGNV